MRPVIQLINIITIGLLNCCRPLRYKVNAQFRFDKKNFQTLEQYALKTDVLKFHDSRNEEAIALNATDWPVLGAVINHSLTRIPQKHQSTGKEAVFFISSPQQPRVSFYMGFITPKA